VQKRISRAREELEWKERNPGFFDATIVNEDKHVALQVRTRDFLLELPFRLFIYLFIVVFPFTMFSTIRI
jgi:hypothetical protein